MPLIVDKFSKLHRLVSHHRETDLHSCITVVAKQMFGAGAIYVDVKQGLTAHDLLAIPSGYVLDLTEAPSPRLFVVKAVIAKHYPFWATGVELFKFIAGFEEVNEAIRDFLRERIAHDPEALARLEEGRKRAHEAGVNEYLAAALGGEFRGLVVIDDARPELNQVLGKINAEISVLELKTYEAEDGSRLYEIDTLYGEEEGAGGGAERRADLGEEIELAAPAPASTNPLPREAGAPGKTPATNGRDYLELASQLAGLARSYRARRNYGEAKRLFKRVLALQEDLLGPMHPDVAESLNCLGLCYRAQGKREKAKPLFERALTIRDSALDPQDPRIATSLNNLALVYGAAGEHALAEPLLERSLAIMEKCFDPEHPRVAISLHNLAELYRALGKHEQAEPLYERAIKIWERARGKHHPQVARVLEHYALLLTEMKRPAQAATFAARAQAIRAKRR